MNRIAGLTLVAAAVSGCGGTGGGTATVWVTRDRGANVVLTTTVPAGLTAMQALERVAHVTTRYAGRYVQGIDGVEGSLTKQRDWFYFVNGYEADRGAAEYRLHSGDVEWWDFRSWKNDMRQPVVAGAFPEPFLHGYDGKRRPAVVAYRPESRRLALSLARQLHARLVRLGTLVRRDANVLGVECDDALPSPRVNVALRSLADGAGGPVYFWVNCANPAAAHLRYSVP